MLKKNYTYKLCVPKSLWLIEIENMGIFNKLKFKYYKLNLLRLKSLKNKVV